MMLTITEKLITGAIGCFGIGAITGLGIAEFLLHRQLKPEDQLADKDRKNGAN